MVRSRSKESILAEVAELTKHPRFKGRINDLGGPTANMYEIECEVNRKKGGCAEKRCLYPKPCKTLPIDHSAQIELLKEVRAVKGVKKVVVASGIRHDMVIADKKRGKEYIKELATHHVSGQLKLAPEHSERRVLEFMGKNQTATRL